MNELVGPTVALLWIGTVVFTALLNFVLGFLTGRDRFYECPNPNCYWRTKTKNRPA